MVTRKLLSALAVGLIAAPAFAGTVLPTSPVVNPAPYNFYDQFTGAVTLLQTANRKPDTVSNGNAWQSSGANVANYYTGGGQLYATSGTTKAYALMHTTCSGPPQEVGGTFKSASTFSPTIASQLNYSTYGINVMVHPNITIPDNGGTVTARTSYWDQLTGTPRPTPLSSTSTGAGTTKSLVDSSKSWTLNQWAGLTINITGGTSSGSTGTVVANTATTLYFANALANGAPDATSTYTVGAPTDTVDGNASWYPTNPAAGSVLVNTTYTYQVFINGNDITTRVSNTSTGAVVAQFQAYDPLFQYVAGPDVFFEMGDANHATIWTSAWAKCAAGSNNQTATKFPAGINGTAIGVNGDAADGVFKSISVYGDRGRKGSATIFTDATNFAYVRGKNAPGHLVIETDTVSNLSQLDLINGGTAGPPFTPFTASIQMDGSSLLNLINNGTKLVVPKSTNFPYAPNGFATGSATGPTWTSGSGVPSGACVVGSLYSRTGGAANTSLYVCEVATGTWTAK